MKRVKKDLGKSVVKYGKSKYLKNLLNDSKKLVESA